MALGALLLQHAGRYRIFLEHLPTALIIGGAGIVITGDPIHLPVALLFGWLIDCDHLFDYLMFVKRSSSRFSIRAFARGSYFKDGGRLILPLHSFEICFGLACLGLALESLSHQWLFTAATAMTAHLIHDHISHKPTVFGYFLVARYRNDFKTDWFCESKNK